ncbi:hypothetical protein P5Y53_15555 [Dyella jiangningensis]|jgi:hypothetical protein|uniref:hypothetical protein n=1 Tax=Dyella jiangningensis TaxID=1379159 RepID=UPI000ACC28DB|nr:hypothetical protein [Dyella jiangningensis]MDG2539093.1 hypothetical protein [Dyella jiangningensis]
MDPTTLDTPFASEEQIAQTLRTSAEPVEGYVLDPWSGLYRETEATYRHRLQSSEATSS